MHSIREMIDPIPYFSNASYVLLFFLIGFAGYILFLPEEVVLITVGYLLSVGYGSAPKALAVCILGIICGDNLVYWLSRKGSRIVFRLREHLHGPRIVLWERRMMKHPWVSIFALRFVMGARFLAPMLSGMHKVKWRTFQLYNALAVLIYTPLLIWVGYAFHMHIQRIIHDAGIVRHLIFGLFAIVILILLWRRMQKRYLQGYSA